MKKLLSSLLALLIMLLLGCGSSNEQGVKDSRQDFMVELEKALAENNIPFTVDDEGYVRYSKEHKESVERIKRQIDQRRTGEVGSKFEDESSTRYFRKLLDEKGITYRTASREDGEWTYWNPESREQQEEIEMKVVAHAFEQQKSRSSQGDAAQSEVPADAVISQDSSLNQQLHQYLEKQQYQEAIDLVLPEAENGNASAQHLAGELYLARNPPDYDRAREWLQKAVSQDYAPAKTSLANLYLTGRGVEKDEQEAVRLLQEAEQQGDQSAHLLLEKARKQGWWGM